MTIKCDVVKDILPLYLDDLCSEETIKLVDEHLKNCGECREALSVMQSSLGPEITVNQEELQKKRAPFKKIRSRVILLLIGKAGLVVGIIYAVIALLIYFTGIRFHYWEILIAAGMVWGPMPVPEYHFHFPWLLYDIVVTNIVRGIVFGVIFAALYSYLPGARSIVKGVALSAFLWILAAVGAVYFTAGSLADAHRVWTSDTFVPFTLLSPGLALASIISALALGALVGFIWSRLGPGEVAERRRGTAALLVGSILGVIVWVFLSVPLIMDVITKGSLAIAEPGLFWWSSILHVATVFLGPAGWIPALLAYRRTRRGESAFMPGVAGGVVMALTGMLLLPGVLSIIGGVLSRREPAPEAGTAAE